jgi:thermitase
MQSAARWFSSRWLALALGAATISVLLAAASASADRAPSFDKPSIGRGAWDSNTPYTPPNAGLPDASASAPLDIDHTADGRPYVAGQLIVSYAPSASAADKSDVAGDAYARVEDRWGKIDAQLLKVPEIKDQGPGALHSAEHGLEADPDVESVSPDFVAHTEAVPNDQFYPLQWGLPKIGAPQAWERSVGQNTVINDLDSGIPEGSGCNPNTGHEDIGGVVGQADFVHGTSFCPQDFNGHGTHTAGIAAAVTNNGVGVAGTSPAAQLLIGKVCEDSDFVLGGGASCPVSAEISGLMAAGNLSPNGNPPRPDVINMSLGGHGTPPQAQHDAVTFATNQSILVVASAGNENTSDPSYPAAFDEAVAVASTTIGDQKSDFSNFGPWVDIAAPGGGGGSEFQDILSTLPGSFSSYGFLQGTSMSAPYVSGVASLIAASGRDAAHIRYRLEHGAKDLGAPGRDDIFGYGLVDADDATKPPDQTRACQAANFAVGLAKAADDKARRKLKKAKRKLRKAKRKLSQAHHNHDLNPALAKKKLRKAKRKAKKAKKAAKAADAGLAQAQTDAQTPCNA